MILRLVAACIGLCLMAPRAVAQTPPPDVFYLATSFCPKGSKSIFPRATLVKIYRAVLADPLPAAIAEVERDGSGLLPCQTNNAGRRQRYASEVFAYSGPESGCPRGSIPADGNLVSIDKNQMLFTLLGTQYGGDGRFSFGVPDLRLKPSASAPGRSALRFCMVVDGVFPSRD